MDYFNLAVGLSKMAANPLGLTDEQFEEERIREREEQVTEANLETILRHDPTEDHATGVNDVN